MYVTRWIRWFYGAAKTVVSLSTLYMYCTIYVILSLCYLNELEDCVLSFVSKLFAIRVLCINVAPTHTMNLDSIFLYYSILVDCCCCVIRDKLCMKNCVSHDGSICIAYIYIFAHHNPRRSRSALRSSSQDKVLFSLKV